MADTDLNIRFIGRDEVTKIAQQVASEFDRLRRAKDAYTQSTQKAHRVAGDLTEGFKGLEAHSHAFSQKIVAAGQSLALGFTVPILSVIAVLNQFDRSITSLAAAESFERTADNFGASADEVIEKLKETSAGTVSAINLARSASRAMVLGVTTDVETFGRLMEIARDRSRVLGLSVTESFDRLVSGIGKQEKEILDELGILVRANQAFDAYGKTVGKSASSLTEAEKVQAFLNATLKEGEKTLDRQELASLSTVEAYQKQRAELENLVLSVQRQVIPALTGMFKAFNLLPDVVGRFTIMGFGALLLLGPLVSAFGSVVKVGEAVVRRLVQYVQAQQAVNAVTVESTVSELAHAAAKGTSAIATTEQSKAAAQSIIARAALMKETEASVAWELAIADATAKHTVLANLNAQAVVREAQARLLLAEASGVQLSRTQALNIAIASQAANTSAAAAASTGLAGGLLRIIGPLAVIATAATILYFVYTKFIKSQDDASDSAKRLGVDVTALEKKLKALEDAAEGSALALAQLDRAKLSAVKEEIDSIVQAVEAIPPVEVQIKEQYDRTYPAPPYQPIEAIIDQSQSRAINDVRKALKDLSETMKEAKLSGDDLEGMAKRLEQAFLSQGFTHDQVVEALKPLLDLLYEVREAEYYAGQAAGQLGTDNLWTATTFEALSASIKSSLADISAFQSLMSQIVSLESKEEIALQGLIAEQQLVIANRKLELNQFGEQAAAEKEKKHWAEVEAEGIEKQIKAIDIEIRERELYAKSLVPPELLQEIKILEDEVAIRGRVSNEMGRHINSLSRVANGIQRQINAIERQARAVERANRPLERQVTLLDLQARRIELASRASRRRLEELQKTPGISGDVIRAAEAEVAAYDKQIDELTDTMDLFQIEIDTRQAVADAIRDQADVLEEQLDLINEEIDVLNDEKQEYDDVTSAIEDTISAKEDYIDTLVPPELLDEIQKLKDLKEQLDLQKMKLEQLIPARDAVRASTRDTFDPIINNAQAAIEKAQTMLDKMKALKDIGKINVLLGAQLDPQFFRIQVLLEALTILSKTPAKFAKFLELLQAGYSFEYLAAYFALPSAILLPSVPSSITTSTPPPLTLGMQTGGIVSEPTLIMAGENYRKELILPMEDLARSKQLLLSSGMYQNLGMGEIQQVAAKAPVIGNLHPAPYTVPTGERLLGSGNGDTYVINVENWWGNDESAIDELAHKIESRIVRRRRTT